MNFVKIKEKVRKWIVRIFIIIGILATIGCFVYTCGKTDRTTTSPIEDMKIDSIVKVNNKLIIEVEQIDSIKDAKVIEVKNLDNDSTLKLFYQLIGK